MYLEEKKAGFGKAIKNSVGSGIFVKKVKRVDIIRTGARLPTKYQTFAIDLVKVLTVFDAILTSRQAREKLL